MNLSDIYYDSEPDRSYIKGLDLCRLRAQLIVLCEAYAELFPDAFAQAKTIKDDEAFLQFRRGLRKERRGKFAGEDFTHRFGAILMPENLLRIGMVADQYKVPFGLAFCRMRDLGAFDVVNNRIRWRDK